VVDILYLDVFIQEPTKSVKPCTLEQYKVYVFGQSSYSLTIVIDCIHLPCCLLVYWQYNECVVGSGTFQLVCQTQQ